MEKIFDLKPTDLIVNEVLSDQNKFLIQAQRNNKLQDLISQLQENSFVSTFKTVRIIELPVAKEGKNPAIDVIVYNIFKDELLVGEINYVCGPKKSLIFSYVNNDDSTNTFKFYNGELLEEVVFDRNGNIYSTTVEEKDSSVVIQQLSCETVCTGICAGGLAGTLSRCISGCLATGPVGTPFCMVLCTLIITFGCAYGCDALCNLL